MVPLLNRRRTLVLTAGVTVTTVFGALIGASLKSRQQLAEQEPEKKKKQETGGLSAGQHIALLESKKGHFLRQREHLEKKIVEVKERAKKREELERERMEEMRKLGDGTAIK